MRKKRIIKLLAHFCRTVLAVTFIVSGFTKTVDPWGTALKVSEYLTIYGWDSLQEFAMPFSIWLCGAELMMGSMLLFKVRIRMVSIFALLSMIFFTVITFLSATVLPVEDCGCFGEALKLTPWQTFFKNLLSLPLAVMVWWRYRPDRIFAFKRLELLLMALFFTCAMWLGVYCYRHLPLVDFLPYKVGVNIHEAMIEQDNAPDEELETILIYRNRRNGRLREFSLEDTEWQNDEKWEWVDTRTASEPNVVRALISEFAAHNAEGDATEALLTHEGRLYMLCVKDLSEIPQPCKERMKALVEQAQAAGDWVVCLTPDPLYGALTHPFGAVEVPCYNVDASTMKTMLRATNGLIILDDGVITAKYNCLDIPL
ncbi:MAG: DoxX protein [Alistipes sp.]|nr:DoxX protein [Alistipes sp.]